MYSLYICSLDVLNGYEGEDIELKLPDDLTVYDIEWLSVWCITYKHNFGHVKIPKHDLNVPPSLDKFKIKKVTKIRFMKNDVKSAYGIHLGKNIFILIYPNNLHINFSMQKLFHYYFS